MKKTVTSFIIKPGDHQIVCVVNILTHGDLEVLTLNSAIMDVCSAFAMCGLSNHEKFIEHAIKDRLVILPGKDVSKPCKEKECTDKLVNSP